MSLHEELIDFVLDAARGIPVVKRIRVYRALANLCGAEPDHDKLVEMADALAAVERGAMEFQFDLKNNAEKKRRNGKQPKPNTGNQSN